MTDHNDRFGPSSYLTPEEAKEFHRLFITSFIVFTIIAIVAHFLVWQWRPWFPAVTGYAAVSSLPTADGQPTELA
jgi:light-harvesting complex 1 beta chain